MDDVFEYLDHTGKQAFADAFAIWRGLVRACQGRINDHVQLYNSENPAQKAEGAGALIQATRAVFKLPDFNGMNGEGATDAYALALFRQFNEWQEKKNQTAASPPTSSPASDSSPATSGLASASG